MPTIHPAALERWMRADAHRFIRPDWRRFVTPGSQLAAHYESIERKYRPDQPRVPAGVPEGGQWTSEGGAGITTTLSAASKTAIRGHHYVPKGAYNKLPLRLETRKVFDEVTTGPLYDLSSNRFDKLHRQYNDAVTEELKKVLRENNIRPEDMTPDQARAFLKQVMDSSDPRIRVFNMRMRYREVIFRFQRALRRGE